MRSYAFLKSKTNKGLKNVLPSRSYFYFKSVFDQVLNYSFRKFKDKNGDIFYGNRIVYSTVLFDLNMRPYLKKCIYFKYMIHVYNLQITKKKEIQWTTVIINNVPFY